MSSLRNIDAPTLTPNYNIDNQSKNRGLVSIKVKSLDLYYRERLKLEKQLFQLNLAFKFNKKLKDNNKATYAATFIRGNAYKQVTLYLTYYLDNNIIDKDNTNLFKDQGVFKTKL